MSNQHHSEANPRRNGLWLAALALVASLGGCVAYPAYGPGYGYYDYGGYPAVAYPAPVVGFGYWGGGGEHWGGGGEHGHWH
jgi:hypothetical protein